MPTALNSANLAILQEHVNAGDRIAYYSQLAEWGYKYAELALEVVNADTLSGRTANHYFLDQASDEGATITNNDLAQISLQLMQEDFAARVAFTGSASGQELPVNTIKDYHETVFNNFGVSDNGWTPNFALESLDTVAEQEAFWDELLNATNPFEATGLLVSPTEGDSSLEAIIWRAEVLAAGTSAVFSGSNSFGPFSVALPNGGFMIGDGLASSTLNGTAGNDIMMGFVGADTLNGGAGDDRLYGGGGADILNGGAGNDILYGDDDDGQVFNSDTGISPDIMDGGAGLDTYYGGFGDQANDSGTDGALDVYNLSNGATFSDADGAYDGAALLSGFGLSLPTFPFQFTSVLNATKADVSSGGSLLGDLINAGIVSYEMNADGGRVLTIIETGATLVEANANWGDGGFELDVGREHESVRGTDEKDVLIGSKNDDLLLGLDGDDRLHGRKGDDEISGGLGNDKISGGKGDDKLYGDRGDDRLIGGSGDDSLWGGSGNDKLFGGRGNDALSGGLGNDILFGGNGNDALRGNGGDDILVGGRGADDFFYSSGGGADIIKDFKTWQGDQLHLDIDGVETMEDLLASASQVGHQVIFDFGDNNTLTLKHACLEHLSADDFVFI